eukprot:SAG31_NODE_14831_length_785_cov_1.320700_1_plen_65_part_10
MNETLRHSEVYMKANRATSFTNDLSMCGVRLGISLHVLHVATQCRLHDNVGPHIFSHSLLGPPPV